MTLIAKPAFTVDGWTANSVDEYGAEWFCYDMPGWYGPLGVRNSGVDRPAGDGIYSEINRRPPRIITLRGIVTASGEQALIEALDRFNGLLVDGGLHSLEVQETYRTLNATVKLGDGTAAAPYSSRQAEWQLVLIAPDPRKFGPSRDLTTGLATSAQGGVPWNGPAGGTGVQWNGAAGGTGVAWQSGSGASGIVTVTNAGNTVAPLTLILTAGASSLVNPAVTDVAGNGVISYGGTVPAGSTLVIDTDAMSALLDGVNRGALLTRADPLTVPKQGSTQLLFTASSGATASLLARVRDTYI